MMHIFLSEKIWDFDLTVALGEISEQRREQALKFRHEQGQRLCVLAYQLLKQGLREVYGITENPVFEYGEHGKPSIKGHPEIHFNLSHCKEAAVCVVSDRPVGVDVESIREYKTSLVRYTMNDEETREIESAEHPALAFIRLWTMKEAAMKLIGTGISNDMKNVLCRSDLHFETKACPEKGYVCSVCHFFAETE
jgi:4'-phosphopantetheinyl transferase